MLNPIKRYWPLYGGWKAFWASPYILPATVFATACYPLWARNDTSPWADLSLEILPSLMGFSIAAMTVLLAFSDTKSLKAVTQGGKEKSFFVTTFANMMHFLVAQLIALFLAILGKAFSYFALSYVGMIALCYAVLVSLAAAGQLLNTARIINKAANLPDPPPTPPGEASDIQSPSDTVRRIRR